MHLPNGDTLTGLQEAQLQIDSLPQAAQQAHIVQGLEHNLISVGKLCDHNLTATFRKNDVLIQHDGETILSGNRDITTGLWTMPMTSTNMCNFIYSSQSTKNIIKFLYAALGSPSISTLISAIKNGYLKTWPGLTTQAVTKYITTSDASVKGHMDRIRKNIRSTKASIDKIETLDSTIKTKEAFAQISETAKVYTDQTGRFPTTSSNGSKYVFILYAYDINAILAEPLKSRTATHITEAYDKIIKMLKRCGHQPKVHWLDNEASALMKDYDTDQKINYQLVPPHTHRRNAAERAIRTWKNHYIANLCTVHASFPLHLWDRLIPQVTMTLNMLRPCRYNKKLSAYEAMHGTYNFDATPMAPLGCKILIHETPNQRRSWDPHAIDGFYIGPSLEHYRCYRAYIPATRCERVAETVEFQPTICETPMITDKENAIITANTLTKILQKPSVIPNMDTTTMDALKKLANIFSHKLVTEKSDEIVPPPICDRPSPPRVAVTPAPILPPLPRPDTRFPRVVEAEPDEIEAVAEEEDISPPIFLPHRYPLRSLSQQHHAHAITSADGDQMEYRHLINNPTTKQTWENSFCNEVGRLAQGRQSTGLPGTNTLFFIPYDDIPEDRRKDVTYARIVVDYRPQKAEPHRTRITVGGNRINYPDTVTTETAELTTHKLLLNSVVSTRGAKYMTADIGNFYLGTPMERFEYMFMPMKYIPLEIQQQYNLQALAKDGKVYTRIEKGMYGLPQAGILANHQLRKNLLPFGYYPCKNTPGLWKHTWRPIMFTLVVDDFGVKYTGREHADHLISALQTLYPKVTTDWTGDLYCGIRLNWNSEYSQVELSMPGYIEKLLHKYQYQPTIPQHAPYPCRPIQYGAKVQMATPTDETETIDSQDKTRVQQIVGSLLYYARAVDPTILPALNALASQQAKPTKQTVANLHQLLDFVATHKDATIVFTPSEMILKVHTDASYLSEPQARSRYGGHFYMGSRPMHSTTLNGPVHTTASILKNVMASAAEAEYGGIFMNAKAALPLRQALHDLDHQQPPTPIQTDNNTASGIANQTIKQKHSKTVDMRFHWIKDRIQQKQFDVFWKPGQENKADYFSKHHPPAHHLQMRPKFLKSEASFRAA